MAEHSYQVKFKGEIRPGAEPGEVRKGLARLYGVEPKRVESLFSGKVYVIKEFPSREQAERFREILETKTGAVGFVEARGGDTEPAEASRKTPEESLVENWETRFRVVFAGELEYDRRQEDVVKDLSAMYRVGPERLSHLFSGQTVTIRDNLDFMSATRLVARFRSLGARCRLEPVAGTMQTVSPGIPREEPVATVERMPAREDVKRPPESGGARAGQCMMERSVGLEKILGETFDAIKKEFRIESRNQAMDKSEQVLGCFFLLVMAGLVALVIATPLKWYMGLLILFAMIMIVVPFSTKWDTRYADVFLDRFGDWKRRDFPVFAATMKKWVKTLPENDRAKAHLQLKIEEIINADQDRRNEVEDLFAAITGSQPQPRRNVPDGDSPETVQPPGINCPRCGSRWVIEGVRKFSWKRGIATSIFLGPLGGAIAGSVGEGNAEYTCQQCGKKWLKPK